jgi:3-oxoacyl-[acyl-carrier-protein] synthase-3
MDGGAVFDFTLAVVPEHVRSLLTYTGKSPDDIDWLVLHQANKQIMQAIAEKSGFALEKTPMETFSTYGNQAGASIPGTICHMLAGELAAGPKTLLLAGYGVGLSWASVVLTMDAPWLSGVRDYAMPPDHQMPEQFYAHWVEKITGRKP